LITNDFFFFFFRVGFPEVPDLNIKVVPVYGENQFAYTLLQDFLQAKIRAELKVCYNFVLRGNSLFKCFDFGF